MDNIIAGVSTVIQLVLNWVILSLAIAEAIIFFVSWKKLGRMKKEINDLNRSSSRKLKGIIKKEHRVIKEYETEQTELNWTAFDDFCNKYQKESFWYSLFSHFIQLFTLLGILGTVAGLFLSLQKMTEIDSTALLNGVKFALSSTILGIIFAVLFKCFDVFLISAYVNYIDDGIMRFKNNYREDREPIDATTRKKDETT